MCHKITEPSAQIPTNIQILNTEDRSVIGHKITEPSAQIPTDEAGEGDEAGDLCGMSQNNRAFRSNPNNCRKNEKRYTFNCHKITEPSAQIPTCSNLRNS